MVHWENLDPSAGLAVHHVNWLNVSEFSADLRLR